MVLRSKSFVSDSRGLSPSEKVYRIFDFRIHGLNIFHSWFHDFICDFMISLVISWFQLWFHDFSCDFAGDFIKFFTRDFMISHVISWFHLWFHDSICDFMISLAISWFPSWFHDFACDSISLLIFALISSLKFKMKSVDFGQNCKFTIFPHAKLKITSPGTIFNTSYDIYSKIVPGDAIINFACGKKEWIYRSDFCPSFGGKFPTVRGLDQIG